MLHCIEHGPPGGKRILFLHAGGYSGRSWQAAANDLPELQSLLVDLPGHGESRHVPLDSLEDAADAVADLIFRRFGGGPVHIVGLSFGGYVGLTLVMRHPDLIRRAMLSGIQLGRIPNAKLLNAFVAMVSPLVRFERFRRMSAKQFGITDPAIYNRADGSAIVTPKTFRAVGRLASDFDVADALPGVTTPTLMMAGEKEHPTILNSLAAFQRLFPDCKAATVPNGGHVWCIQQPDLFARTVRAWVLTGELADGLGSGPIDFSC